jgi:methionyl-tRNA formyltransferase
MRTNVVATVKSWNIENFKQLEEQHKECNWVLISEKDELTIERLQALDPEFVFFPHWSWIIPKRIYEAFECVVFHMTDLPFGRGGHPLQNLIVRGIKETKVSAIKAVGEVDAGPVYAKRPLDLSGSAEDIYRRASKIVFSLIASIAKDKPIATEQEGEIVTFERRTREMSKLPGNEDLEKVYDWIRMLDAEGYPQAYVNHGDLRLTFRKAERTDDAVIAEVVITRGAGDE